MSLNPEANYGDCGQKRSLRDWLSTATSKRTSQTCTDDDRYPVAPKRRILKQTKSYEPGSYNEPSHPIPTQHLVSTEEPRRIDMFMPSETIGSHHLQYLSAFVSTCVQREVSTCVQREVRTCEQREVDTCVQREVRTCMQREMAKLINQLQQKSHLSAGGGDTPLPIPPTPTSSYQQLAPISSSMSGGEQVDFTSAQQQTMGTGLFPAQQSSKSSVTVSTCRGSQESFQQNLTAVNQAEGGDTPIPTPTLSYHQLSSIPSSSIRVGEEDGFPSAQQQMMGTGLCPVQQLSNAPPMTTWGGSKETLHQDVTAVNQAEGSNTLLRFPTPTLPYQQLALIPSGNISGGEQVDFTSARQQTMGTGLCPAQQSSKSSVTVSTWRGSQESFQQDVTAVNQYPTVNPNHESQSTSKRQLMQPAATEEELSEFLNKLQDDEGLRLVVDECKDNSLQRTVTNIMQLVMTKSLAQQFTWTGATRSKCGEKKKFRGSPTHEFLKKILGKTRFANAEESEVKKTVVTTLRNVPDWNGGRLSRRKKNQSDPGRNEEHFHMTGNQHHAATGEWVSSAQCPLNEVATSQNVTDFNQDAGAVNPNSMPKTQLQPATSKEELLKFLQMDDEMVQTVVRKCEDDTFQRTVTNIMKFLMTKSLALKFSWTGASKTKRGAKEKFGDSPAHEILKKILGKTSFKNVEESEVKKAVVRTFHNVPDWNGGRCSRMRKSQCDLGEVATTSRIEMKNPSVQTSERNGESDADSESDTDDVSMVFESKMWSSLDQATTHEKVDTLMKDLKFREAIALLEAHPVTEIQQMTLLECYIKVGEDTKISEVVENMKTLMTQNPDRKAKDVLDFGEPYLRNGSYIEAITLYACAGKLYLRESNADEIVRGIAHCGDQCSIAISYMIGFHDPVPMVKQNAGNVVMKIMNEFIDDIMSVENADPDEKVELAAMCLNDTGERYVDLRNYDKAKECYERGIDIMNKHFGSNSSKYWVFGSLLEGMGDALCKLGNDSDAESFYRRAIDAYKQVEDLDDGGGKRFIEDSEKKLDDLLVTNLVFDSL